MIPHNPTIPLIVVLVAASAVTAAATSGLSSKDRADLIQQLQTTERLAMRSVAELSEEQWAFRPAADKWSVGEVVEHLVLAEGLLRARVMDLEMSAMPPSRSAAETEEIDHLILDFTTDRSQSFSAPAPIQPSGSFATPAIGSQAFLAARAQTLEFVRTTDDNLRAHRSLFAPANVELDGVQWLLFIAAHTQRHLAQIDEIKQAPGYPVR